MDEIQLEVISTTCNNEGNGKKGKREDNDEAKRRLEEHLVSIYHFVIIYFFC